MARHGTPTVDRVLHGARAYDVLVWVLTRGRERRFREHLSDLAHIGPGDSVLDVGCGTGRLAMVAKDRAGEGARVCGVDPSREMVARARRKAARARVDVGFETAAVEALPFPDATFDAVLGTLMLHHLTDEGRHRGIAEIGRVLKPGGRFLAVDIGGGAEGKRHGLLHRLPNHGHFDLEELTPVLEDARLQIAERGPIAPGAVIGLSDLRFVLAVAPAS